MKPSRFSMTQIVAMLDEQLAGIKVADICRKYGVSPASFYKFKAKYGGMHESCCQRGVKTTTRSVRIPH